MKQHFTVEVTLPEVYPEQASYSIRAKSRQQARAKAIRRFRHRLGRLMVVAAYSQELED